MDDERGFGEPGQRRRVPRAKVPETAVVLLTAIPHSASRPSSRVRRTTWARVRPSGPLLFRVIRYSVERKRLENERQRLEQEQKEALSNVKVLGGLVSSCANCKNIRDDEGFWN